MRKFSSVKKVYTYPSETESILVNIFLSYRDYSRSIQRKSHTRDEIKPFFDGYVSLTSYYETGRDEKWCTVGRFLLVPQ